MPIFFDPTFIIIIPALIFSFWAQAKVKSTFEEFSQRRSFSGITGADAARRIMNRVGISDVRIEYAKASGLSDHYDPKAKVLRLSDSVYASNSVAALGVAAHEVGHAIQHNIGYFPLKFRSTFVPVASFGSKLAFPLFFIGLILRFEPLLQLGIIFFGAAVLFHLITLPVEIDASRRALIQLQDSGIVSNPEELSGAKKVLSAAALTYIAATLMALLNFLRMILLSRRR